MEKHPRHVPLDMAKYRPEVNGPETYYGIGQNVEFCANFVISNQRPNSAVEFAHTKASRKGMIRFDDAAQEIRSRDIAREEGITTADHGRGVLHVPGRLLRSPHL